MPRTFSLRFKVALGISLFAIVLLLAQALGVRVLEEQQEETFIDQMVQDEMAHLVQDYRADPHLLPPYNPVVHGYITRYDAGIVIPAGLQRLSPGIHEVTANGRELHVAVAPFGAARLYRVYDFSPYEHHLKEFVEFLLLGTGAFALLSTWLSFGLSGLLVRQLADLTQQVRRFRQGATQARLTGQYSEIEVAELADAFNRYHQRMAELIDREKEFTANASHELRTPLTAILTSCELLAQDAAITEKSRKRVEGIQRNAARMTELINSLLLLAREDSYAQQAPQHLRPCVEEAVGPFRETLAGKGILIDVQVPADARLAVSRPALMLVLTNLVRNATVYTSQGSITIRYRPYCLTVADTGIGIPAAEAPHVFDRFYRGQAAAPSGLGLGLAIVKRICDRHGWQITLNSEAGQGTQVSIDFQPA